MKYLAVISIILGMASLGSGTKADAYGNSNIQSKAVSDEVLTNGYLTNVPERISTSEEVRFQVVGLLENSCRHASRTSIFYDENSHTFSIEQMIRTVGQVCLQRIMPFSIEVNLGRLQPGSYRVQIGLDSTRSHEFRVDPNTTELR